MAAEQYGLQVIEFNGTARSGKGTIVAHLSDSFEGVADEETGADYRAVTFQLLQDGRIDPDMSAAAIDLTLAAYGAEGLTEIAAARRRIVGEHGLPVLYSGEVSDTVYKVAPNEIVRGAVKKGFMRRVEAARDDPAIDTLVIDGRNLAPVIARVPGTRMIMRVFVECGPLEAALRECARNGVTDFDEVSRAARSLAARNRHDAGRQTDPVRADNDALGYWSHGVAWSELEQPDKPFAATTRVGVGIVATMTGRQVYLDSGEFRLHEEADPRGAMLAASVQLYEDAKTGVDIMDRNGARDRVGRLHQTV